MDHKNSSRLCIPVTRKNYHFIYLNRTCWNGLYRENLRGEFNVPRGSKNTVLYEDEDFSIISDRLKSAAIHTCGYSKPLRQAGENDLVFVDPPYTVKHNLNGFVKYNQQIFQFSVHNKHFFRSLYQNQIFHSAVQPKYSIFSITPQQFSYIVSVYAGFAGVFVFLSAFFIDRFDRKWALLVVYIGFTLNQSLLLQCLKIFQ